MVAGFFLAFTLCNSLLFFPTHARGALFHFIVRLPFLRIKSMQGQGVHRRRQFLRQYSIHQLMALYLPLVGKRIANDGNVEMRF